MSQASELKSALWDAADALRGAAVDRTDWKGYILPLLFFKRISEVGTRREPRLKSFAATLIRRSFPRSIDSCPIGSTIITLNQKLYGIIKWSHHLAAEIHRVEMSKPNCDGLSNVGSSSSSFGCFERDM